MAGSNITQSSFNYGELSPEFEGASESEFYNKGLSILTNFYVRDIGTVYSKEGTRYLITVTENKKVEEKLTYFFDMRINDNSTITVLVVGDIYYIINAEQDNDTVIYKGRNAQFLIDKQDVAPQIFSVQDKQYLFCSKGLYQISYSEVNHSLILEPITISSNNLPYIPLLDLSKKEATLRARNDGFVLTVKGTDVDLRTLLQGGIDNVLLWWDDIPLSYGEDGRAVRGEIYCKFQVQNILNKNEVILNVDNQVRDSNVSNAEKFTRLVVGAKISSILRTWDIGNVLLKTNSPVTGVALFDGRLWIVNDDKKLIYGSCVGNPWNFQLGILLNQTNDMGAIYTTLSDVGRIAWIQGGEKLFIGTDAGVYCSGSSALNDRSMGQRLTQSTLTFTKIANVRCSKDCPPVRVNDSIFFVSQDRHIVYELAVDEITNSYKVFSISKTAQHILSAGIRAIDYTSIPNTFLSCVLDNGNVAIMGHNKGNSIYGWSRFIFGGLKTKVLKSHTIRYKGTDRIYYLVARQKPDGNTQYTIEYIDSIYSNDFGGRDLQSAFSVDCGITRTRARQVLDYTPARFIQITMDTFPTFQLTDKITVTLNTTEAIVLKAIHDENANTKPYIIRMLRKKNQYSISQDERILRIEPTASLDLFTEGSNPDKITDIYLALPGVTSIEVIHNGDDFILICTITNNPEIVEQHTENLSFLLIADDTDASFAQLPQDIRDILPFNTYQGNVLPSEDRTFSLQLMDYDTETKEAWYRIIFHNEELKDYWDATPDDKNDIRYQAIDGLSLKYKHLFVQSDAIGTLTQLGAISTLTYGPMSTTKKDEICLEENSRITFSTKKFYPLITKYKTTIDCFYTAKEPYDYGLLLPSRDVIISSNDSDIVLTGLSSYYLGFMDNMNTLLSISFVNDNQYEIHIDYINQDNNNVERGQTFDFGEHIRTAQSIDCRILYRGDNLILGIFLSSNSLEEEENGDEESFRRVITGFAITPPTDEEEEEYALASLRSLGFGVFSSDRIGNVSILCSVNVNIDENNNKLYVSCILHSDQLFLVCYKEGLNPELIQEKMITTRVISLYDSEKIILKAVTSASLIPTNNDTLRIIGGTEHGEYFIQDISIKNDIFPYFSPDARQEAMFHDKRNVQYKKLPVPFSIDKILKTEKNNQYIFLSHKGEYVKLSVEEINNNNVQRITAEDDYSMLPINEDLRFIYCPNIAFDDATGGIALLGDGRMMSKVSYKKDGYFNPILIPSSMTIKPINIQRINNFNKKTIKLVSADYFDSESGIGTITLARDASSENSTNMFDREYTNKCGGKILISQSDREIKFGQKLYNGENINITIDGQDLGTFKVRDNQVTNIKKKLDDIFEAHIGYGYYKEFCTLDLSGGAVKGSSVGAKARQIRLMLRLYNSGGGEYCSAKTPIKNALWKLIDYTQGKISDTFVFNSTDRLTQGSILLELILENDIETVRERYLHIRSFAALPLNILSITRDTYVSDN